MIELLDVIMTRLMYFVVCGDINIDFLVARPKNLIMEQILLSHSLHARYTEITKKNPRGGGSLLR